jgi:hypothetical protein
MDQTTLTTKLLAVRPKTAARTRVRRRRSEWVEYVIERDGKYYQQFHAVGFLWEIDGRWLRDPKRASKYPRLVAVQIAAERGGVAVRVAQ